MWSLNERIVSAVIPPEHIEFDNDTASICVIDQFDAQEFNINECGVIRSDISKLARAQSQSEYDAIMKRIGISPARYGIDEKMTIKDAFERVRPRSCQSPCELQAYVDSLPYDSASVDDAYRKALSDVDVAKDSKVAPADSPAASE